MEPLRHSDIPCRWTFGLDVLVIENVGNLVCPASYDLGEDIKMVALSVTEEEDKPSQYGYVPAGRRGGHQQGGFDGATNYSMEQALGDIKPINSGLEIFGVSCCTGQGVSELAEL